MDKEVQKPGAAEGGDESAGGWRGEGGQGVEDLLNYSQGNAFKLLPQLSAVNISILLQNHLQLTLLQDVRSYLATRMVEMATYLPIPQHFKSAPHHYLNTNSSSE